MAQIEIFAAASGGRESTFVSGQYCTRDDLRKLPEEFGAGEGHHHELEQQLDALGLGHGCDGSGETASHVRSPAGGVSVIVG